MISQTANQSAKMANIHCFRFKIQNFACFLSSQSEQDFGVLKRWLIYSHFSTQEAGMLLCLYKSTSYRYPIKISDALMRKHITEDKSKLFGGPINNENNLQLHPYSHV